MRKLRLIPKRFRRKRRKLDIVAQVVRDLVPMQRVKEHAPIILTIAAQSAVLVGLRKAATGAGLRCVVRYAARGALVGAMGGAVPILFAGWTAATEVGALVRAIGEGRLLRDVC